MIPPDAASDLSIFTLFWQAHWIVKSVMIGLMACSVWVWAIAVDKTILYSRTSRAMDGFEQSFWSGQSLEELYRMVSSRPNHSMAALFVAAMQEWKRSFERPTRSFAGLQMRIEKVMDVIIMREIERLERRLCGGEEVPAVGRQCDLSRGAIEKPEPQLALQFPDQHAQAGRRQEHAFCGPREALVFCDEMKGPELA